MASAASSRRTSGICCRLAAFKRRLAGSSSRRAVGVRQTASVKQRAFALHRPAASAVQADGLLPVFDAPSPQHARQKPLVALSPASRISPLCNVVSACTLSTRDLIAAGGRHDARFLPTGPACHERPLHQADSYSCLNNRRYRDMPSSSNPRRTVVTPTGDRPARKKIQQRCVAFVLTAGSLTALRPLCSLAAKRHPGRCRRLATRAARVETKRNHGTLRVCRVPVGWT